MVAVTLGSEKKAAEPQETETKNESMTVNVETKNLTNTGLNAEEAYTASGCHIAPQLNSAFFCCSLRRGTQFIGRTFALVGLIEAVLYSQDLTRFFDIMIDDEREDYEKSAAAPGMATSILIIAINVAIVVASFKLLIGVLKKNDSYLKPFIAVICLKLFLYISCWMGAILETGITNSEFGVSELAMVLRFLFEFYSILVVNSHRRELKEQSSRFNAQIFLIRV